MLNYVLVSALGYLIGSIPVSYFVSKQFGHIDIRNHGSGNAGATNVFRTLGKKAGIIAFIGDFAKGVAAALIGRYIMGLEGAMLCGLVAVLGHCFPFTIGFKGGKGVATSAGMVCAVSPLIFAILVVFQALVILLTRYMSLASILSAIAFPIAGYFLGMPTYFIVYASCFSLFVVVRHWANVKRLVKGTESKLNFSKKK